MNGCSLLHPLKDYQGPDMSIEISLKEYGIAWCETDKEWHFLYGIGYDKDNNFNRFGTGWFAIDTDPRKEFSWMDEADWKALMVYMGFACPLEEYLGEVPFPVVVHDVAMYFGRENVFGGTYYSGYSYDELEALNNDQAITDLSRA